MADYRYAVGTVARSLAAGPQVVSGITDALGSFPIKAVLLYTTFQDADAFAADARLSFGFSDATQHCSVSTFTENANASTKFSRSHYSNIWALVANNATQTGLTDAASVSALGTGEFTLSWIANDGVPWDVHYIVFGGTDLNAKALTAFSPAAPGTQAVTGVGFQPTTVIFLDALSVGDASWGVSTIALCPLPTVGWSDGTNHGAFGGNMWGFPANTSAARIQRTDAAIVRLNQTNLVVHASVESFDADGFTLDWTAVNNDTGAGGALAPGFYALAIGGPSVVVGSVLQSIASITGLTSPALCLLTSQGQTASASAQTDTKWTFGAVDQQDHIGAIWMGNLDGAATSVAIRDRSITTIPTAISPNVVPATSAVDAAVTPNLGASSIALTWSPNDAVNRQVLYLAFEGATAPPSPPAPFPAAAGVEILMRKLRRSTTFSTEKLWNFFSRFELDFQAGGPRDGNDPIMICLRYSDDAGNTWSDEIWLEADVKGGYDYIADWYQLGRGRDRVWEVFSDSPAMTVWLAAYLDVVPGTH